MESISWKVMVLTCDDIGVEVANRIQTLPGVGSVVLVVSPYRSPKRTLLRRLRHAYRALGPVGFLIHVGRKLLPSPSIERADGASPTETLSQAIRRIDVEDFHSPTSLATMRDLQSDLGVVAGTYILRRSVFDLPKHGCINLHSGKAPRYRGAAPVFWELYNGESEVGITIHRVTDTLDGGAILRQELYPIDPAPAPDPLLYIEQIRTQVLRPAGVRLLTDAVRDLINGTASEIIQDSSEAHTYRTPDFRAVKELRKRVQRRRRGAR
jgi:methionyl-tRNA formyltransferase